MTIWVIEYRMDGQHEWHPNPACVFGDESAAEKGAARRRVDHPDTQYRVRPYVPREEELHGTPI